MASSSATGGQVRDLAQKAGGGGGFGSSAKVRRVEPPRCGDGASPNTAASIYYIYLSVCIPPHACPLQALLQRSVSRATALEKPLPEALSFFLSLSVCLPPIPQPPMPRGPLTMRQESCGYFRGCASIG